MKEKYGIDSMGETAENVYELTRSISREEQDRFSLDSHRRAVAAIESGKFAEEIVPVPIPQSGKDPILVSRDEHPRADTSMEALGKLRPAFRAGGTVTAGNSSGINDGAAAVLLMSDKKARDLGMKPLARVVCAAAAGVEPRVMGLGPISATRKALSRAGLTLDQIGLIELNEAFAVQALAVMKELGMRHEITNVNGGAVALGHPLGCSGARLMTTLVHEMRRRSPGRKSPTTAWRPFASASARAKRRSWNGSGRRQTMEDPSAPLSPPPLPSPVKGGGNLWSRRINTEALPSFDSRA